MRRETWAALTLGVLALCACERSEPAAGTLAPEPERAQPAPAPVQPPSPPAPLPSAPEPAPITSVPAANPAARPAPGLREVFPSVRVDVGARLVEFDGIVPVDAHDPDAPHVYLELVACTPDTREHESLVMTSARAEHVHAALLLIGLEPGRPGGWRLEEGGKLRADPPAGPNVDVRFVTKSPDGSETVHDPRTWIVSVRDGSSFPPDTDAQGSEGWLFAGSRLRRVGARGIASPDADPALTREVYDAQYTGALIGLTTFGSETLAWHRVISPEAAVEPPVWIANRAVVPAQGTPVIVRLRPGGAE